MFRSLLTSGYASFVSAIKPRLKKILILAKVYYTVVKKCTLAKFLKNFIEYWSVSIIFGRSNHKEIPMFVCVP